MTIQVFPLGERFKTRLKVLHIQRRSWIHDGCQQVLMCITITTKFSQPTVSVALVNYALKEVGSPGTELEFAL